MRNDVLRLSMWALAAVITLASGVSVKSPLLARLKGECDRELRAIGIHPEGFDGHQLLKLQADAAAMRERFGHRYATDYLGDTSLELKINSPYPATTAYPLPRNISRQSIVGDRFEWARCKAIKARRASFLRCNLLDANVTSLEEVLALMQVSVEETRFAELEQVARDWWSPDVETNVTRHEESFFLIRPLSVSSEWRYLVCSGDYTYCEVRIHLRQIASLDAFDAQLDIVTGLMDEIKEEERRLLAEDKRSDYALFCAIMALVSLAFSLMTVIQLRS